MKLLRIIAAIGALTAAAGLLLENKKREDEAEDEAFGQWLMEDETESYLQADEKEWTYPVTLSFYAKDTEPLAKYFENAGLQTEVQAETGTVDVTLSEAKDDWASFLEKAPGTYEGYVQ
jgi:hypothetical protein